MVLTLGDAKEATPPIDKTLNPEWNTTLELPVTGQDSLLLEACCWDKDRFGKDYMGEFDVVLEDVFRGCFGCLRTNLCSYRGRGVEPLV